MVNGELVVSNINGGGVPDWISMLNGPVNLAQGKTYVVSFQARSTASRAISIGPRKGFGDYAPYSMREKLIDTTMRSYSFTYTHTAASDSTAQLIFFLGNSNDTVYIDNLTMGEKIPRPSTKPALKLLPIGDSISQGNIYGAGT